MIQCVDKNNFHLGVNSQENTFDTWNYSSIVYNLYDNNHHCYDVVDIHRHQNFQISEAALIENGSDFIIYYCKRNFV